jgi:hypothetical protein
MQVVVAFGFFHVSDKDVTTGKSLAPDGTSGDRPGVAVTT